MLQLTFHVAIVLVGFSTRTSTAMSVEHLSPNRTIPEESSPLDDPTTIVVPDDLSPKTIVVPDCTFVALQPDDVIQLKGKNLVKQSNNLTFPNSQPYILDESSGICFTRSENLSREIFKDCEKWEYNEEEYSVLPSGSVLLYEVVLEPGSYEIKGNELHTCADEYEDDGGGNSTGEVPQALSSHETWSIYIGQVGSGISIVALTAHLVSFCVVPAMRNLPGYNLASLSLAFLLGYLFALIGQIPQVLGFFCVLCGILVQIFFLAAFFCMNTLAFDVWRTLRMATTQLCVSSHNAKRKQFLCYCVYAWGTPILIMAVSVIVDNVPSAPKWIRPEFGKNDVCWMTNHKAKLYFFTCPAFALFVANAVFFVLSALIIKNNTLKGHMSTDQGTRNNFTLYARLGAMMGVTWLFGVVALAFNHPAIWLVFDVMNSLQGLFVFVLFTCSRKLFDHVRGKMKMDASALRTPKTSTSDLTGRTVVSNHKTSLADGNLK